MVGSNGNVQIQMKSREEKHKRIEEGEEEFEKDEKWEESLDFDSSKLIL